MVLQLPTCAPGEMQESLYFGKSGNGPCAALTMLFVVDGGTICGDERLVGKLKVLQGNDWQEYQGGSRGSFLVALKSFEM